MKLSLSYLSWSIHQATLWNELSNIKLDDIKFIKNWKSDIWENSSKRAWYTYHWSKRTDEHWKIRWWLSSFRGWTWLWTMKIKINNVEIIKTWNVNFKTPFQTRFDLIAKQSPWKTLIWYENQWKISLTNISSNIQDLKVKNLRTRLELWKNSKKFKVVKWRQLKVWNPFDVVHVTYDSFFPKDRLNISYKVKWSYSFKKDWKNYELSSFDSLTNPQYMYKSWKLKNIRIKKLPKIAYADWSSSLDYEIRFIDEFDFPMSNMSFDMRTKDPQCVFDLNQMDSSCQKAYSLTKIYRDWKYLIYIRSFVPAKNASLKWSLKNIKYNWYYSTLSPDSSVNFNDLNFEDILSLRFQEKVLTANVDDSIDIFLEKNTSYELKNIKYLFIWRLQTDWTCPECEILNWKRLDWNSLLRKSFNIFIKWTHKLRSLIYKWFVSYELVWKTIKLRKTKTYSPIIRISWWKLFIIWNISSNKAISWNFNYIANNLQSHVFINQMKKYAIIWNRWKKREIVNSNITINLKNLSERLNFYECRSENRIDVFWNYEWNKELIVIWCDLNIINDIVNTWKWGLKIFVYKNNGLLDFSQSNWRKDRWNIYIWENVKTIQSSLITNWSIITYIWNLEWSSIFTSRNAFDFKRQLYINWKIFAKNTVWWWIVDADWKYTLLWWKKFNRNDFVFWYDADLVAQSFDMRFWRDSLLSRSWTYITWNISQIIQNKYNCTWNKSNDSSELCYSSVIIEDSNIR